MHNTDKRQKRIEVLVNQGDLDDICCEQNGNVSIFSTYQTYEVMKVFTKSILKCFGEEYELTGENDLSDGVLIHTNLPFDKLKHLDTSLEKPIVISFKNLEQVCYEYCENDNGCLSILSCCDTCHIDKIILKSLLNSLGKDYSIVSFEDEEPDYDMWYDTNLPFGYLDKINTGNGTNLMVERDDIENFWLENKNKEGDIIFHTDPMTKLIDKILIRSILKSYGEQYRIEEIEKSRNGCSESCITNLPCTETNIMFNPNYYKSI